MSIRGEIIGKKGDVVTVKLYDELDVKELKKQAINGRYYVTVDIFEKDSITDDQRRHFLALCGDISEYEGVPVDTVQAKMKYDFMKDEDLTEFPSVARNRMKKTTASKLIEFVILHCIDNDIPFRKENWYLDQATSKQLFALTMKRICWICGREKSEIAHVESVGAGRNRKKIDHTKHHLMCLCREHHKEQHQIGINHFIEKYHIKPIKLNRERIKELGL